MPRERSGAKKSAPQIRKKIVVIYHGECPDGFGAAWAAWKKFGARAAYIGIHHEPEPPPLSGKSVYLLDIVYPPEAMRRLARENERVIVIDHHVTARESVAEASDSLYDIGHSGATLAWKYFHPGTRTPRLLEYLEDQDLWKFSLPRSKELNTYVGLFNFEFPAWSRLAAEFDDVARRGKCAETGKWLLAYESQLLDRIARTAEPVRFLGYRVLAVNAPHIFSSALGNMLSKRVPPLAIVWSRRDGATKVSLRSDGTVDVAKIAQRFGGGGHKAASGFSVSPGSMIPWTHDPSRKKHI